MPNRWLPDSCVASAIISGARNAVTLPEKANSPKNCAVLSGGARRASSVRLADWTGADDKATSPANRTKTCSPVLENTVDPGAFGATMDEIRGRGLDLVLREAAAAGVPIFGICIGMQVLFEESEEFGRVPGLVFVGLAHVEQEGIGEFVDVAESLAIARANVRRHRLGRRVRVRRADVYAGLGARRYDVIVSNPPYVSPAEMRALPPEYRAEPAIGLHAPRKGLAIIERILRGARRHLTADGILVVEAGDTAATVRRRFPRLPFTWLEFERGGGGVFLLRACELPE